MSASKDTEEHMRYNGPVDAVRRILKDEGAPCVKSGTSIRGPDFYGTRVHISAAETVLSYGTVAWMSMRVLSGRCKCYLLDWMLFLFAGPLGFFDGMRTKIVQTVLAAAIMFYIREKAYTATRAVSALLLSP